MLEAGSARMVQLLTERHASVSDGARELKIGQSFAQSADLKTMSALGLPRSERIQLG